jgi:hypothetical protein
LLKLIKNFGGINDDFKYSVESSNRRKSRFSSTSEVSLRKATSSNKLDDMNSTSSSFFGDNKYVPISKPPPPKNPPPRNPPSLPPPPPPPTNQNSQQNSNDVPVESSPKFSDTTLPAPTSISLSKKANSFHASRKFNDTFVNASLPSYKNLFVDVPPTYVSSLKYFSFSLKSRDFLYSLLHVFLVLVSSSSSSFSPRYASFILIQNGIIPFLILLSFFFFFFLIFFFYVCEVEKEMLVGEMKLSSGNEKKRTSIEKKSNTSLNQLLLSDNSNPFNRNNTHDFKISTISLSILAFIMIRVGKFFFFNLYFIIFPLED